MRHFYYFLSLSLLFPILTFANTTKVLIKANILRGESIINVNVNPVIIEKIFEAALLERNIHRVNSQLESDSIDLLYLDVFVFQFPSDYPTVSMVIRSREGVHRLDYESKVLFGDRVITSIKLAEKIAERIPQHINRDLLLEIGLEDILYQSSYGITKDLTNSIMKSYRKKYDNQLKWNGYTPISFIVSDFEEYFSFCADYHGFRNKVRYEKIILHLQIGADGIMKVVSIDAPFSMKTKIKFKLYDMVVAIPQWIVETEIKDIELHIGTKPKQY